MALLTDTPLPHCRYMRRAIRTSDVRISFFLVFIILLPVLSYTLYSNTAYISTHPEIYLYGKAGDGTYIEIDLECLLKKKEKSENFVYEKRGLQRTQFNSYCKDEVSRVGLAILAKICDCLDYTPNDVLKIVKETAKDE